MKLRNNMNLKTLCEILVPEAHEGDRIKHVGPPMSSVTGRAPIQPPIFDLFVDIAFVISSIIGCSGTAGLRLCIGIRAMGYVRNALLATRRKMFDLAHINSP